MKKRGKKAWVISVDAGYGHQRAAYPLKDIANERIITANSDKIISDEERKLWHRIRNTYEFISRLKETPFFGKFVFGIYDKFQEIPPFFPFRDLSMPTFGSFYIRKLIRKKGLCQSVIEYVKKEKLPFVTTHFIPALAAHYSGLKKIYCVITDTDINRVWVPVNPKKNTIKYLASCKHVVVRLKQYGIKDKDIIFTGFPLPKENIGGRNYKILKKDLGNRLANLDPKKIYIKRHGFNIRSLLGRNFKKKCTHPLTITYMVGGAGAQQEIGITIIKALKKKILSRKVVVNLVAGTRLGVRSHFEKDLKELKLSKKIGKGINIIFAMDKKSYFTELNEVLRHTDIVWTKPSEMSFYTGLGLPIIIAPPVGAHEKYNREWLQHIGSGFVQENPEYTDDWLFYWLEDGRLAEAAWEGFVEAPNLGTYEIENLVLGNKK